MICRLGMTGTKSCGARVRFGNGALENASVRVQESNKSWGRGVMGSPDVY